MGEAYPTLECEMPIPPPGDEAYITPERDACEAYPAPE